MTEMAEQLPAESKPKKKFEFPSAFTILFLLLVLIAAATFIIPAGTYDYNEDGEPVPGTYHEVPSNPQKLLVSALKGPINGMYGIEDETGNVDVWNYGELFGAIDVAMFVLIIGGFLGVTMKTGAINAGIAWVVEKLQGKEKWMFPILMTIFAIGGTSYGMAEETLAFYALIITVMLAAGYDGLSAAALILLGAGIGVLGSTINPFATGIASGFAGTTISEGLIGRLIILVIGTALGIWFVVRYAEKVKQDPSKSLIHDQKAANEAQFMTGGSGSEFGEFTGRHKVILALFFLAF
ncbi:MAG: C4-dicarboxylate ABC transporter, partial [Anaerolineae bacterium]